MDQLPQTPTLLPELPPPQKSFTPKFISVVLILVALGAGASYGIWWWQQNQPDQTVVPTFTPRADETSNWQTYTSFKFGFSFKYPVDWYIVGQHTLVNHDAQLLSNYKNADSFGLDMPADLESLFFEIYQVAANSTLDSLKPKTETVNSRLVSFEKFTTGQGLEGRKVVYYSKDHPVGNHTIILFIKDGLEVSFSLGSVSEDQINLFNQILSTFKFTDSGYTSNWQTYTNTQYGFEFKYPQSYQIKEDKIMDSINNIPLEIFVSKDLTKPGFFGIEITPQKSRFDFAKNTDKAIRYMLDNKDIIAYQFPNGYEAGPPFITFPVAYGNQYLIITISGMSNIEGIESQILSTFKFIK